MRYLLTFKPLKHFFFGNNKTFSDDYVAKSEYFPQNTQLLGALRLFIAEQNNLMKVYKKGKWSNNPQKLKKLVGDKNSLGMIQNLSQMFIVDDNLKDAYFPTPFDINIQFDKGSSIMDDEGHIHIVNYPQRAYISYYELDNIDDEYFLNNYDVKKYSNQMLGNHMFWNAYLNYDTKILNSLQHFEHKGNDLGVFIKHSQVGIELDDNKTTKEGQFYSKTDYTLRKGFLFGCVIELEEQIINDGIITLGAENSIFELKVHNLEDLEINLHPIVSQLFTTPKKSNKIVAISESFIDNTKDLKAYFTIAPFYKNFATIYKDKSKFKGKTVAQRLLPNGSVIYPKDDCILPKAQSIYQKIGYNQFIGVGK